MGRNFYPLQRHLTKHAVELSVRKKKKRSKPLRNAPRKLVATNVIAKSTRERRTVPKAPISNAGSAEQRPSQFSVIAVDIKVTAR